jgi:outer membrane protein OmpA-like peptidoglycan-associated protein
MPVADAGVADAQRVAEAELRWYRDNPDPKSTPALEELKDSDEKLTLWNFPVAKADLAPAHREVLVKFAAPGLLAETPEHPRMDFYVEGHASVTGGETSNEDYAGQRAKNVAAILTGLGIRNVRIDSAGSTKPEVEGTDPQALARNRRVVVMRSLTTYRVVPPPPPQQPSAAPGPTGSTVQVIVPINLALAPLSAPRVVIAPFVIGDLTVAVRAGDPLRAGVTTTKGEKPVLTEEFEKVLVEQVLNPRLGVKGGTGKEDPLSINIGVATEEWFLTPKVYYQHGSNFISFNFKAVHARLLPIVPFNDVEVILEFSGSIRFDIGPSADAVRTYPSTSDPGPNVTGTVGEFVPVEPRALAIAATITDAGKKASQLAQKDIEKMVLNLARRDGAACWVAWEAIGEEEAGPAWRRMRVDWHNRVPNAEKTWMDGNEEVEKMLKALEKAKGGEREKRANDWKKKYGGATPHPDFEFMREAVFQQLKGYDEDEGDLQQLIEDL